MKLFTVTYATQLPIRGIETVLGHDPRSNNWKRLPEDLGYIYSHLKRATTKARLDSIIRYIRYRFIERSIVIGAFPAISIAVQNPTPFKAYDGIPEVDSGVGVLEFDLSRRNNRVLVDGLGRVGAGMELMEISEKTDIPENARKALQTLMGEFSLPMVFYASAPGARPFSLEEMQQLFHDFNFKAKSVDWDRSNPVWADIIRENVDKDGNVTLGLAKGGAQNRRFITKKLRGNSFIRRIARRAGI